MPHGRAGGREAIGEAPGRGPGNPPLLTSPCSAPGEAAARGPLCWLAFDRVGPMGGTNQPEQRGESPPTGLPQPPIPSISWLPKASSPGTSLTSPSPELPSGRGAQQWREWGEPAHHRLRPPALPCPAPCPLPSGLCPLASASRVSTICFTFLSAGGVSCSPGMKPSPRVRSRSVVGNVGSGA